MAESEPEAPARRRSVLLAGAAGLATAGVAVSGASGSLFDLLGAALDVGGPGSSGTGNAPSIRIERVRSAARGREVDLVTLLPPAPAGRLPVCLFLHGLHGDARHAMPTGLGTALAAAVIDGTVPPFAFVAVDGGDHYWHDGESDGADPDSAGRDSAGQGSAGRDSAEQDDDPMAMLLAEVPAWLRRRNLGDEHGRPFGCAGVSMGGFGALLYARRRAERGRPASAVAAISPGLLLSWREMSTRRAFRDNREWAALDPLRNVAALGDVPVGIWCGTDDHFIEGTRKFIRLADPELAYTGPGGHGDPFYRRVAPDVVAFLGRHVR